MHLDDNQGFWRLWASTASANLADGVLLAGLPVLATTVTTTPALVAGVQVALMLPMALCALPSGVLADRHDRRLLLVTANAGRAIGLGVVLTMLGVTAAWAGADWRLVAIYTAAALAGSTEILADSAAETAVPGLVGRAGLEKAHSRLIGTQVVLNDAVGAPVGSWLATIGFGWTLGIPAVLYAVAGLVVRTLRLPAAPSAGPGGVTTSSVQNDIRAGTSFVWNHGLLRRMAFGNMAMNLGNTAFFAVAVLILIGPMGLPRSAFGFFLSLLALGGVVGSLVAERVVARLGQAVTVKSGPVVLGAGYGVICLTVNPIVTAVAAIGIGASGMLWNVANRVVRQRATPDAVLGRVTATMKVLALAMTPVGAVVGGAVGQWLGVRAVGYVAVGSAAMAFLALWGIPDHPSPMPNQVFDTPHRTR